MSDFDHSSTHAMVWATAFCETAKENGWTMENIDEGLMVAWFANYWAAVHDPLNTRAENAEHNFGVLLEEKKELEAQLAAAEKDRDGYMMALQELNTVYEVERIDDAAKDRDDKYLSADADLTAAIDKIGGQ